MVSLFAIALNKQETIVSRLIIAYHAAMIDICNMRVKFRFGLPVFIQKTGAEAKDMPDIAVRNKIFRRSILRFITDHSAIPINDTDIPCLIRYSTAQDSIPDAKALIPHSDIIARYAENGIILFGNFIKASYVMILEVHIVRKTCSEIIHALEINICQIINIGFLAYCVTIIFHAGDENGYPITLVTHISQNRFPCYKFICKPGA